MLSYRTSICLCLTYIVLRISIPLSCVVAAEPGGEKKILLIGHNLDHAWGTHMYLPTCKILAKCLTQTPGVNAIVSDGWPKDKNAIKGVDALVLYSSPGGEIEPTPKGR